MHISMYMSSFNGERGAYLMGLSASEPQSELKGRLGIGMLHIHIEVSES